MNEKITNVYKTDNLRKFRFLLDNRQITEKRVNSIIKSINDNGYLISPIITNEKYEIIDGQGRFKAATKLGLPIYYMVIPGIGIKECRAMNFCNSNWKMSDFIYSYSQDGMPSYINLRNMMNAYEKILGANTIYSIATNTYCSWGGSKGKQTITNGNLEFNQSQYEDGMIICKYLSEFAPLINEIGGRKEFYYTAIKWAFLATNGKKKLIDANLLLKKAYRYKEELKPCAEVMQALVVMEGIYNKRNKEKVFFVDSYREYMNKNAVASRKRYRGKKEES